MRGEEAREVTCLVCPLGCRARVTIKGGRAMKVENLECPRGEEYVLGELRAPRRDFFTTVRVRGAEIPVCPVRATQPVPKEKVMDCASELAKVVVEAPIKRGETIVQDLLGLRITIVATRSLDRVT